MKAWILRTALTACIATAAAASLMLGFPQPAGSSEAQNIARLDAQSSTDKYWLNARRIVGRSVRELLAQHETEIERGLRFHKLMRGDPSKKQVAITFDDGPHPKYTPQILRILRQYNVKATFFLVGEMAEKYPALVKAELGGGHAIGNHTYHHVDLRKLTTEDAAVEIKACGEVLQAITGDTCHLFRPPGGDYDKDVAEAATALGYMMVLWTDDPGDYASPGRGTIQLRLLDKVSNGGIILIHDGIQQTIDVLPQILQILKNKGYEFITIDQMLDSQRTGRRSSRRIDSGKWKELRFGHKRVASLR